jgi:CheY-like chemotaxis protein
MQPSQHERIDELAPTTHVANGEAPVQQECVKPGVLVVDDEHMIRIMVQLGLEQGGFEVWSAANGREAIELYQKHREHIAVVLLDIRMPGLDGIQTLNALRELNPNVLACFMSGSMGACDPEKLQQHGAAHVIAKPFHLDQLLKILWLTVRGVPGDLPPPDGGYKW